MSIRSLFAGILLCCRAATAVAYDGAPDAGFGEGGWSTTTFSDATDVFPLDTAVLADGRLVTLSLVVRTSGQRDIGLLRFLPDGGLDTSFSFDGTLVSDFGGNRAYTEVDALAVQPDGRILVCGAGAFVGGGSDDSDMTVARFNADGTLDPAFGDGGRTHIHFALAPEASGASCHAIALQPDGRIVLAGEAIGSFSPYHLDIAVARLDPDGTLDPTFDGDGRRGIAFNFPGGSRDDTATSVAIARDGSILVAGYADHGTATTVNNDMVVAKLTPSGALDPDFDADGKASVAFDRGSANDDEVQQVLVQPDGRVVLVGFANGNDVDGNYDFAVARLFPDGSPDTTFGPAGNGRTRVPFDAYANGIDLGFGGVLEDDGKLVVGGLAALDPEYAVLAFARLDVDGSLDTTFGQGGRIHFGATSLSHLQVARHPRLQSGRVVAAIGNYSTSAITPTGTGIVRLEADAIFANGFQ